MNRKMDGIGTLYFTDGPRVYRINHIYGRLIINERGIQTIVDSTLSVKKSLFGLKVLSDESSLKNERGGQA